MNIAIFDHIVAPGIPTGNCTRLIVQHVADHQFTVFAARQEQVDRGNVAYVHVPVLRRPLFLLFLTYHLMAPMAFLLHRWRTHITFDLIQIVEDNLLFGDVSYAHFCHRAYLDKHWATSRPSGVRRWARWLDHSLRAWLEPFVFGRVRQVVVPSHGLRTELEVAYPERVKGKIRVIANPIPVERLHSPPTFDRDVRRAEHQIRSEDLVLVFVALGHFERKGLPILLEALRMVNDDHAKLLVVGGMPATISAYRARAADMGVLDRVRFVGMQDDIRPFLWMSDVFAFPSSYETFSMVVYEAAAAGLPVMVTTVHGVDDMLIDGVNGWRVARSADAFATKIRHALSNRDELREMGMSAAASIKNVDVDHFVREWEAYYRAVQSDL